MKHRFFRIALLNVALLTFTAAAAQDISTTVTGMLGVTYHDNLSDPALSERTYTLHSADGASYAIDIPDAVLGAAGGIFNIQFRPLEITLSDAGLRDGQATAQGIRLALPDTRWFAVDPGGNTNWKNLLCKLPDVGTTSFNTAKVETMFGSVAPGLADYWSDTSHGVATITSSTTQWQTLPRTLSQYLGMDFNTRANTLMADCKSIHGYAPSGSYNVNTFYNAAALGGYSLGGYMYAGSTIVRHTWIALDSSYPLSQSLIAHEMGHAYGMPHSNNNDGDGSTYDNPWDVMSAGYEGAFTSAYGYHGQPANSYYYQQLGFIPAARQFTLPTGTSADVTIDTWGADPTSNVYIATIPVPGSSRFYTVEVRKKSFGGYDGNVIGDGVLIYQIEPARQEPAWMILGKDTTRPYNPSFALTPGEVFSNTADKINVQVLSATANGYVVRIAQGTSLAKVTLNSPADDSAVRAPDVTFSWTKVDGAASYKLKLKSLDKTQSITLSANQAKCSGGVCTLSFNPANHAWKWREGQVYKWEIVARNASGITLAKSAKDRFTVDILPDSISILTPLTNAVLSGPNVTFQWNPDSNFDKYRVTLKNGAGVVIFTSPWTSADSLCAAQCSYQTSVTTGEQFTWRVTGRNLDVSKKIKSTFTPFRIN